MRLVILDRDGVINADSPDFIKSPAEWRPLPGSLEALARLAAAGRTVVVASNQSGVGRGLLSLETLAEIHDAMCRQVAAAGGRIDRVFFCPHRPDEGCDCRKPRPGLFRQVAAHYRVDLAGVPAIGDSLRDIDAARAAGARPMLILTGNGAEARRAAASPVETYPDLGAAVDAILGENNH
ncbi:MAG: D-glycero-beta-D-manno-heptose 1,7-bisphosphate 7-phosphatase [Gammaproteobacteria bacterium]